MLLAHLAPLALGHRLYSQSSRELLKPKASLLGLPLWYKVDKAVGLV